jgi:hypothetical protein
LRIEAAAAERGSCSFEVRAVGRALELEIGWTRVGESDRHVVGSLRSVSWLKLLGIVQVVCI